MKTVLITGGSSGIGAETAILFASKGYNVAISYNKNKQGAEDVAHKIEAKGVQSFIFQADLTEEENAKNLVLAVIEKFETIDILINNAGRYIEGDEWNGNQTVWTQTLLQNLVSAMSVSKYVIELFTKQQSGVMVNISSRHGVSGVYDAISYSAAKAGIINITQSYSKLLSPFSRVCSLSLGAIKTGYWSTAPQDEIDDFFKSNPKGRFLEVDEVAQAIFNLATDKKKESGTNEILIGSI